MNFSDLFLTMAQTTEIDQTSLFPFPFSLHLLFCCFSLIFFLFRFIKEKYPYQIIMAVAIPFSLVIWISESKPLFYTVGIVETVLLLTAFITSLVFRTKEPVAETLSESAEEIPAEIQDEEE
ncbi:MAG: hypothetical protein K2K02_08740 [Ruminococcus sp.]|nr:hypothetical protein [Ruminococcus sp.]